MFHEIMFWFGCVCAAIIVLSLLVTYVINPGWLAWEKWLAYWRNARDTGEKYGFWAWFCGYFEFYWEFAFTLHGGFITGGRVGKHRWGSEARDSE